MSMRALLNDDIRVCVCNRPAFGRFVLNGKFTAPAENEKDASWELYMHVEEQTRKKKRHLLVYVLLQQAAVGCIGQKWRCYC